jgi:GNAT superfamily N-acetyltransferase
MASLTVRPATSKADYKTFLTFPWTIYRGDPYWVPTPLSMVRHKLDRQKNATWQHMEGEYFVAWRGDQPVGTIAGLINHRHNEYHDENIGFFGHFECLDDAEAAHALLDTAADYVRAKGANAIRGPLTFSTNDECGLLIDGFHEVPVVLYPYNPPYYQTLIESAPSFSRVMDALAFRFTLQETIESDIITRMGRITEKNNARRGITIRTLNPRKKRQDLTALKEIYNNAWEKNWGFVPYSEPELDELVADLGMYIEPETTLFAEVNGRLVAFLLAIPDLNQALHLAYPRPGKLEILSLLQVLWHWKLRPKIDRIRIPLMGVEAAYRGIGVEAAMFHELFKRAIAIAPKNGWAYADGGWVLETNESMIRLVELHNGQEYRRYRFYERPLTP